MTKQDLQEVLQEANVSEFDSPLDILKKIQMPGLSDEHRDILHGLAQTLETARDEHGVAHVSRALSKTADDDEAMNAFLTEEELDDPDSRVPLPSEGAATIHTCRLPYVEDPQGREDYIFDWQPEASGPRYCMGGLMQKREGEKSIERGDANPASPYLRMLRVEVILPPQRGLRPSFEPSTKEHASMARCIPQSPDFDPRNLGEDQTRATELFIEQFMRDFDLTFMDAEPIQPKAGFNTWVITLMDKGWSQEIAPKVKDAIYTKLLKSNAGYIGKTAQPDYREIDYVAVTPMMASIMSEAFGGGPYIDREGNIVADGRSPLLMGRWPEREEKALETQFRAYTGELGHKQVTLSKGVVRPIAPAAVEEGYKTLQQWHIRGEHYLAEGDELREMITNAMLIFEMVLEDKEDLLILVKGDQMKVGDSSFGTAHFAATYLRGSFSKRSHFEKIAGNSQLYQFLNMNGREKLKELFDWSIQTIAENQKTLPGVYKTASEVIAKQAKEIAKGQTAYKTGADGLSDALTGGGVRLTGKGWRYALLSGEIAEDGVHMIGSTKRRYDQAVATHMRRHVLQGMCTYGYGFLHGGTTNSTTELFKSWHRLSRKEHLEACRNGEHPGRPYADPCVINIPRCVTRRVNADDDGDIINGVAAHYGGMKVVMFWRYPCVDLPVFIAFPKGTATPFDPEGEEEAERFKRIIGVFDPAITKESAPISDDRITELTAQNAWRMQDAGAKENISKEKRKGPNTIAEGMKVAKAIGDLNMTGVLTRELERIGELICMTQEVIDSGPAELKAPAKHLMRQLKGHTVVENGEVKTYKGVAQQTLKMIEDQLTAFKYDSFTRNQPFDLSRLEAHKVLDPVFGPEPLRAGVSKVERDLSAGYGFEEPGDAIELQYHKEPGQYRRVLSEMSDEEVSFEEYEGLPEGGLMAEMLREIDFTPVVEAVKRIKSERTPFLRVLQKQLKQWMKVPKEEKNAYKTEAKYIVQMCKEYRRFWREVIETGEMLIDEATDRTQMEANVETWQAKAGRQITLMMKAMSRKVSRTGLALGIYQDWTRKITGGELKGEWRYSTAAGMALISGRMGEILLPAHMETISKMEPGRHAAVYCKGHNMPIAKAGWPVEVDVRIDRQNGYVHADIKNRDVEPFTLYIDSGYQLPPSQKLVFRLARTNAKSGVLSWRTR